MSNSINLEDFELIEEQSTIKVKDVSSSDNTEIETIVKEFSDNEMDSDVEDDIYQDADSTPFEKRSSPIVIDDYDPNNSENKIELEESISEVDSDVEDDIYQDADSTPFEKRFSPLVIDDYDPHGSELIAKPEIESKGTLKNALNWASWGYNTTKSTLSWGVWGYNNIALTDETVRSLKVISSVAYTIFVPTVMLSLGSGLLTASLITLAATSAVVCAAHYAPKLIGGVVNSYSNIPIIGASLKPAATIETSAKEKVADVVGNRLLGKVYTVGKFAYNRVFDPVNNYKALGNHAGKLAGTALAVNTASQYVTENGIAYKMLNGIGRITGKMTDKGYEAIGTNIARSGDHLFACSKDVLSLAYDKAKVLKDKLFVSNLSEVAASIQLPSLDKAEVSKSDSFASANKEIQSKNWTKKVEGSLNTVLGSFAII